MSASHESFWQHNRYAVVGHGTGRPFPRLTYNGLKAGGKTVFAVDESAKDVEGDKAYKDLASLPKMVDGMVVEVPREETADWVRRAAKAGVPRVWIHMGTESPEAVEIARESGLELHTGTCAVMYLQQGFSYHSIHKWLWKALGKY